MTDIISAIDQATGCQQCGKPLERSVSDDFCGEGCQQAWHAKRTLVAEASGYADIVSPPLHTMQGCRVIPLDPVFEAGDVMTLQELTGSAQLYQHDGTGWVHIGAAQNVRFNDVGDVTDFSTGRLDRPGSSLPPQYESTIRAVAEQVAQACGIPPELLGYQEPTCAEVVRNAVHIRGNGTSYMP